MWLSGALNNTIMKRIGRYMVYGSCLTYVIIIIHKLLRLSVL